MGGRLPRPKDPIFLVQTGTHKNASTKILRDRVAKMAAKAGLRGDKRGKRHEVPVMNGFRRFWNKTCKESSSGESALASLIKKEYVMSHRGLVALDQNYFKTNLMDLAIEYVKVVADLTIDDSERLKQSNRRMAENIQTLEGEKDAKIAQLEGQIRSMGEEMSKIGDRGGATTDKILDAFLKSPKSGGVPGEVMESFTTMMKQLGAAQETAMRDMKAGHDAAMSDMKAEHDAAMRGMKAEYDAKTDRLLRAMDRMAKDNSVS